MGITAMKINRLMYLIGQGFRGVFSHGFRSFASVVVIIACLIIMGSFSLLSVNVDSIIRDLEEESEVLAFVDESLTEDDARLLESVIRGMDNVRDVQFITRETAMENYKAQYEDQSLFEDIDASVFRHRYVIFLEDITLMAYTGDQLRGVPGIADVNDAYVVELAEGFITVRNVVSAITMVLIVILLVVSLFIMANTIKLAAFTRREEIAVMKMVGAGNGFIRMPFVVEGMILGLLGGAIAFVAEWGIYNFISEKVMGALAGSLFTPVAFGVIMMPLLLVFLAVGVLVGSVGGAMAIRNYLKV